MSEANINLDYSKKKIIIELPLTDENILEAHGFMTDLHEEPKKQSPAPSDDSDAESEEHRRPE